MLILPPQGTSASLSGTQDGPLAMDYARLIGGNPSVEGPRGAAQSPQKAQEVRAQFDALLLKSWFKDSLKPLWPQQDQGSTVEQDFIGQLMADALPWAISRNPQWMGGDSKKPTPSGPAGSS